ncbi:MAG: DUF1345 domain-containing protein [Pseudomonadota bacterium]
MFSLHRFARSRPYLSIAIVVGVLAVVLAPAQWPLTTTVLAAWNIAVWTYLCLMGWLMVGANHAMVRRVAEQEDKGAGAVLVILSLAATASLFAIFAELAGLKDLSDTDRLLRYGFTGSTILGSWLLVAVLFTLHYAREFYRSPPEQRALRFPDEEKYPTYWEFMYFSFTIAVAAQTSDVKVMNRPMRKIVIAQSVLSFAYNVAIVGLAINIAAGIVGG